MKLWIARNYSGSLFIHKEKPELNDYHKYWCSDDSFKLEEYNFPEVTFENSPREIELKLVNENVGVAESPLKTFPRINEFEVGASYRR